MCASVCQRNFDIINFIEHTSFKPEPGFGFRQNHSSLTVRKEGSGYENAIVLV
jgi:hypothetical protein